MVPTRKLPRIAYFWPGLPQLWLRGSWVGLVIAVGFTALVNTLILATFVFSQWIPLEQVLGGYGVVAVSWLVGWWQSRACTLSELSENENTEESSTPEFSGKNGTSVGLAEKPGEQLFCEAQRVYLQGDWVAAEQMLLKLLKLDDRDAEARLMLATLWRRQGRHRESFRQLDKLSRLEAADPWEFEIAREREENAAALEDSDGTTTNEETHSQVTETPSVADAEPSTTQISETTQTSETTETSEPNRRLAA